jgi:L-lactate utilization protein LutC
MIEVIRRALGRTTPLQQPPTPPEIPDSIARLSSREGDIPQRFAKNAADAKFLIEQVTSDELPARLLEFVRLNRCENVGISASPLFDRLEIPHKIQQAGMNIVRWTDLTLDTAYDLDCGITDVYAAVAETGSLVIRPDSSQGRALSLVPPIHIAVVEPQKIVPDLIDLLEKVAANNLRSNVTLITGPSKTADIEGALVTGVHGPGLVQVYLLTQ